MDLTPGNAGAPLPPVPIATEPPAIVDATTLLAQLGSVRDASGQAIPTRRLPGDIPVLQAPPESLYQVAQDLHDRLGFDLLSCVSGVDLGDRLQVVYHLRATRHGWLIEMKVDVPADTGEVDSVAGLWSTANWLERETYDMYGILFAGHPDLRRILLDDEFIGFPLRKSFRPTPLTAHDRATTEVSGEQAVESEGQRGIGEARAVPSHLSQGDQERFHPGTPTFGSTQFHGRSFPPQTWKHQPDYQGGGHDEPPPAERK
jgi:NADH/F420H2 dehydrogenase subunit C